MKRALITGITGQDGSYLAELLLKKGYRVFGLARRSSTFNTQRIDHLIEFQGRDVFEWERGDMTDTNSLIRALMTAQPEEVYHLAAQSHVQVSFENPIYTTDVLATGTLRLLEAVRSASPECKLYNAGSSEMFGSAPAPQNEETPFEPRSPYAIAKVAAYHNGRLYRDSYNMPVYNGILFNHESPRRGETFVTRKITRAVARIAYGVQHKLTLGNLDSHRDWGYAPEYVEAMWRMMQERGPEDYVIATGEAHSVREFVVKAFSHIGITLEWKGQGLNERGVVSHIEPRAYTEDMKAHVGDAVVVLNEKYIRPAEVDFLLGDSTKASRDFGWEPQVKFEELVSIMMDADLRKVKLLLDGTRQAQEEWRQFVI